MYIIVDVETTGLDPGTCDILELGILVLENNFKFLDSFEQVIHYGAAPPVVSPVVIEMHNKNGLWEECMNSPLSLAQVELEALNFLNRGTSTKQPLTGSTISFDRAFLKKHMPKVEAWFHYRNIDVSSFRLLAEKYGKPIAPKGVEAHRSLSDCHDSAKALEYYVKLFGLA